MVDIPNWANWLARDEDGVLYAFEKKPIKSGIAWHIKDDDDDYRIMSETDDTFSPVKWTDEEPTQIKRGLEAGGVSVEELNRIINAKANGYDEVPIVADKTEPVYIDIDVAKITVDETHSISFEEAMALVENKVENIQYDWLAENRMVNEVDDIADKRYETPDIINEPNHYKGKHGIETIDVIRNFGNDDMIAGFYWGNAIKYMTRYRNKNGLEDLKKARKNLDWLIEHVEAIE